MNHVVHGVHSPAAKKAPATLTGDDIASAKPQSKGFAARVVRRARVARRKLSYRNHA